MLRNSLIALKDVLTLVAYDDEVTNTGVIVSVTQYLADALSVPKYAFITGSVPPCNIELYHIHGSLSRRLSDAVILF
jgi:hypothetical protein